MLKLVKPEGRKFWYARGTINGRRIFKSTKETVRKNAAIVLRQIEDKAKGGEPGRAPTFAEVLENYIDAGGETRFLSPILAHFGKMTLDQINNRTMRDAVKVLYPDAANSTIRRQLYVPVNAIMNLADEDEIWTAPRLKAPKVKKVPMKAASDEWFDAVLPECSPHLYALLLFMATTGWRTTEAVTAELDLGRGTATIPDSKNKEGKQATMTTEVIVAIANAGGSFKYHERNAPRKALKAACERAGVEYLKPHQVGRHTFATNLLRAGKSVKFVQDAGSWKSARLVMETYGHLEQSEVRTAATETVQNWLTNLKRGSK